MKSVAHKDFSIMPLTLYAALTDRTITNSSGTSSTYWFKSQTNRKKIYEVKIKASCVIFGFLFFFIWVEGFLKSVGKESFSSPPSSHSLASHELRSHRQCQKTAQPIAEDSSSLFAAFQVVLRKHEPFWMFSEVYTRQMQPTRYLVWAGTHCFGS